MASLTKTKTLFGFTSPRTIEKIIPEIKILCDNFSGRKWSGNEDLQIGYFRKLFESDNYEGEKYPSDPALASRDRITRAPKALGFVDLKPEIKLTAAGTILLSGNRPDEIFTKQLLKFQLPSPYHTKSEKIDFNVRPYLELLRLIREVGSLSKVEIALFFLQLVNYSKFDEIVSKITKFREDSKKFVGSRKTYVASCFRREIHEIYAKEIEDEEFKTRESSKNSLTKFIRTKSSNMKDYADAYVRYIRATELVTFERKTFRLIISPLKIEEVDFLLLKTPRQAFNFKLHDFKNYLFDPATLPLLSDDRQLLINKIQKLGLVHFDQNVGIEQLKDILEIQTSAIKTKNIEEKTKELKDHNELPEILSVFKQIREKEVPDPPLFLEWNVWRAMVMLNHAQRIDGNFVMDIDGMPLNYAPGNKPDIEVEFHNFGIITEVTMSSGNTQFNMEGESVPRHFGRTKESMNKELYCIFIAPQISDGTLAHFFNLNRLNTKLYGGKTKIIPLSIDQFIGFVESGIKHKFNNPQKLMEWLERQWEKNQNCDDEQIWHTEIDSTIHSWAS